MNNVVGYHLRCGAIKASSWSVAMLLRRVVGVSLIFVVTAGVGRVIKFDTVLAPKLVLLDKETSKIRQCDTSWANDYELA
jgi:hypothetical protein